MDRLVRVPVQVFPVLPFVGPTVEGALVNLSSGGMALLIANEAGTARLARGTRLRVHFRLPGLPLTQCKGTVTHAAPSAGNGWLRLGVKFMQFPASLNDRIQRMLIDDAACDARMADAAEPRCDLACAFHSLCSKPIRLVAGGMSAVQFEIALQRAAR
jgi:hypothetical protein